MGDKNLTIVYIIFIKHGMLQSWSVGIGYLKVPEVLKSIQVRYVAGLILKDYIILLIKMPKALTYDWFCIAIKCD